MLRNNIKHGTVMYVFYTEQSTHKFCNCSISYYIIKSDAELPTTKFS